MRICLYTTAYPRSAGDGDGAFVQELAKALLREGHAVLVVAMHSPGTATRELLDGVQVYRPQYLWPARAEGLRRAGAGGLPITWKKYPRYRWQIVPFVVAHSIGLLRMARPCDVIHAQWTLCGALAGLLKPLHRRPVATTLHGTDVFQSGSYSFGGMLLRLATRYSDVVTVVSGALRQAATGDGGAEACVIPNGVDTDWFHPDPEVQRERQLLFVGSLIERKGVRYLIQALGLLTPALADYRLVVTGDGPLRAELGALATELGLTDRVEFTGAVDRETVRALARRSRALVLPSLEEGFGVVLLEALACGTPVIGSDLGGIAEVITPEVGCLVPSQDPPALAQAIEQVVTDEAQWEALSRGARRLAVERYSWDRVARQVVAAYESARGDAWATGEVEG